MASSSARRLRGFARVLGAQVWQGLVALGGLQVAGERAPARGLRVLDAPPPGHPERLRPDLPLTALERALLEEPGPTG